MIPPGVLVSDSYRDSVNKEPIVLFPNRDTLLDKVDNDRDIIHYGLFRSMKAICEIKMGLVEHLALIRKNNISPSEVHEITNERMPGYTDNFSIVDQEILKCHVNTTTGKTRKNQRRKEKLKIERSKKSKYEETKINVS